MRLAMRRSRVGRLYPVKSKPRVWRRYSSRSSRSPLVPGPLSTGASGIGFCQVVAAHGLAQVGDGVSDESGPSPGVPSLYFVAAGLLGVASAAHTFAEPRRHVAPACESHDRCPEGSLQRVNLLGQEAVGGVRMADTAPEAQEVVLLPRPERAPAFGAGELGGVAL